MKRKNEKRRVPVGIAIAALVINIFLPGVGSMIGGRMKEGLTQFLIMVAGIFAGIIFILSVVMIIPGIISMLILPLVAWIWGIITGINLIMESK